MLEIVCKSLLGFIVMTSKGLCMVAEGKVCPAPPGISHMFHPVYDPYVEFVLLALPIFFLPSVRCCSQPTKCRLLQSADHCDACQPHLRGASVHACILYLRLP